MTPADIVAEALAHGCEGTSVSPAHLAKFECVTRALAYVAERCAKAFDEGKAAQGAALSAETQALLAAEYDANDKLRERMKAAEERAAKAEARATKLRAAIVRVLDQRNKLSAVPYSIAIEALDEDDASLRKGKAPHV